MFFKNILLKVFMLFLLFGAAGITQSQEDKNPNGEIKITLPDLGDIFGSGTYDENGYDKEGYDRNGYNRYGYDRSGYDRYGYDRYGYDRYGYDRNGYDRNGRDRNGYYKESTTYSPKEHQDNGKHKGWYKNKHKNDKHDEDDLYEHDDD